MGKKELTQNYLKKLFDYNIETGMLFWKINKANRIKKGMRAGCLDCSTKYRRIRIDGKNYYEHRIIYLWMTGKFPNNEIDHRNLVRNDNRWINLREATFSQNRANTRVQIRNKCKVKGVCYDKDTCKYQASIGINNKLLYLGLFNTANEAGKVYQQAANRLFGEFANY